MPFPSPVTSIDIVGRLLARIDRMRQRLEGLVVLIDLNGRLSGIENPISAGEKPKDVVEGMVLLDDNEDLANLLQRIVLRARGGTHPKSDRTLLCAHCRFS